MSPALPLYLEHWSFLTFCKDTSAADGFVPSFGEKRLINVAEEVKEVENSYGLMIFSIGDTTEEEVRNIFAILDYIQANEVQVHLMVAESYSTSRNYNERVKDFNNRVVRILVLHIRPPC